MGSILKDFHTWKRHLRWWFHLVQPLLLHPVLLPKRKTLTSYWETYQNREGGSIGACSRGSNSPTCAWAHGNALQSHSVPRACNGSIPEVGLQPTSCKFRLVYSLVALGSLLCSNPFFPQVHSSRQQWIYICRNVVTGQDLFKKFTTMEYKRSQNEWPSLSLPAAGNW